MINEIFMFVMGMFLSAWTYLIPEMYNGNYPYFNLYFVAIVFLWTGIIEYKYKDTYSLGEFVIKSEDLKWNKQIPN